LASTSEILQKFKQALARFPHLPSPLFGYFPSYLARITILQSSAQQIYKNLAFHYLHFTRSISPLPFPPFLSHPLSSSTHPFLPFEKAKTPTQAPNAIIYPSARTNRLQCQCSISSGSNVLYVPFLSFSSICMLALRPTPPSAQQVKQSISSHLKKENRNRKRVEENQNAMITNKHAARQIHLLFVVRS